jgi:hypothetical protein
MRSRGSFLSIAVGVVVFLTAVAVALALPAASGAEPLCEIYAGTCPDSVAYTGYGGEYIGHDEPAILFYSNQPGVGQLQHLAAPTPARIACNTDPRRDRRHLELPAQQHVLVRDGSL